MSALLLMKLQRQRALDKLDKAKPMMKSELLQEYAPYHFREAFHQGWDAYESHVHERRWLHNPFDANSVNAQAWDRGAEAAMRWINNRD